jgi:hypothetical protein
MLAVDIIKFLTSDVSDRWGSGANSLEFLVPPIDAFTTFVGASASISQLLSNNIDDSVNVARDKDVTFVFVNASAPPFTSF